jgi:hypothetical protein
MNKFVTLILLAVLAVAGLGTYWYVKPHHMPRFLSDLVPRGIEVPTPRSPVSNFRPPQF